jgi:hypothetical protein
LHRFAQVCTGLHWFAQVCTGLHWFPQVCTGLQRFALVCTALHRFALVCTGLCHDHRSDASLTPRLPCEGGGGSQPNNPHPVPGVRGEGPQTNMLACLTGSPSYNLRKGLQCGSATWMLLREEGVAFRWAPLRASP